MIYVWWSSAHLNDQITSAFYRFEEIDLFRIVWSIQSTFFFLRMRLIILHKILVTLKDRKLFRCDCLYNHCWEPVKMIATSFSGNWPCLLLSFFFFFFSQQKRNCKDVQIFTWKQSFSKGIMINLYNPFVLCVFIDI